MADPFDIRMAASITITRCNCGSVYIRLHDRAGEIFAAACMPLEVALIASERISDECEAIVAGVKLPEGCLH